MRPSHLSYTFLAAFLGSTFLLRWWQQPAYPFPLWLLLGFLGVVGFLGLLPGRTRTTGALLLTLALGTTLALLVVSRSAHVPSPQTVDFYADGRSVALHGIIADEPDVRPELVRYVIDVRPSPQPSPAGRGSSTTGTFDASEASSPLPGGEGQGEGRVLVTDRSGGRPFSYGDVVTVRGKLELPGDIEGFRYDHYLALSGIRSVIYRASIERTGDNEGNPVLYWIYSFKAACMDRLALLYPEPHASLLAGLLLGSRAGLPQEVQDAFRDTGLTHLVAISGYNITLLLTVIGSLLCWLPLRWRFVPSVLIIVAFTILVGASASVVRAAVMGILGLIALHSGRTQTMRLTILWALCLMLLWNPIQLWYDAGFQLSFLAVIGLLEVSPLLERPFSRLPEAFGIRQSLQSTMAVQATTVPLMLMLFGRLSLIAPVSNLLAPPLVPIAMLLGFVSLAASALWVPLGSIVAMLTFLPLEGILLSARLLAWVPFASVGLTGLGPAGLMSYYVFLVGWAVSFHQKTSAHS